MSLTTGEKRLLKDVIYINKNPLNDQGIFYIHNSNNIKKDRQKVAINKIEIIFLSII